MCATFCPGCDTCLPAARPECACGCGRDVVAPDTLHDACVARLDALRAASAPPAARTLVARAAARRAFAQYVEALAALPRATRAAYHARSQAAGAEACL